MKQYGTVLVFKPGLSKEEIEKRLRELNDIIDNDGPASTLSGKPDVHSFDSSWGGPVWYVP